MIPFISEEIWNKLKEISKDKDKWPESIMFAQWPDAGKAGYYDEMAEKSLGWVQDCVSAIRDLRSRLNIPPTQRLRAVISSPLTQARDTFKTFKNVICRMVNLESLEIVSEFIKTKSYLGAAFPDFEVFIHIEGLVDPEKERPRIEKKLAETRGWLESLRKKLSNEDFVRNAPPDIVEREKEKLADAEKIYQAHQELLNLFQ